MDLTPQQVQALDPGDAVPATVASGHCAIIRHHVYERTQDRSDEERDVLAVQPLLARLAPEDWEDASIYE